MARLCVATVVHKGSFDHRPEAALGRQRLRFGRRDTEGDPAMQGEVDEEVEQLDVEGA